MLHCKLDSFWAKTDPDSGLPCLSVQDHCLVVGLVAKKLEQILPQSLRSALPVGSTTLVAAHDLGKLTPGFQLKAPKWQWHDELFSAVLHDQLTTNHAIVSQWHLQTCSSLAEARKSQYWLVSIGGHHGAYHGGLRRMTEPPNEGGDTQFAQLREELLERLIDEFGSLPSETIGKEPERIHLLTGFTIFSDWIGSNTEWFSAELSSDSKAIAKQAEKALKTIHWNPTIYPNLSFTDQFATSSETAYEPRPIQSALLSANDSPGLYIVEAPMGMGKTEAALTAAYQSWTRSDAKGLYFALPTQLTSSKIHDRIFDFLRNVTDGETIQSLIHGNAWLSEDPTRRLVPSHQGASSNSEPTENESSDTNEALRWYSSTRKQLLAPFGTGTIDQALLAVLPARFAALRYFALAGKAVVIDEVHSFDPYMSALIDRLIRYLIKAGSTVIILSATLTAQRRSELVAAAGAREINVPNAYPLITKVAEGHAQAEHFPVDAEVKETRVQLRHEQLKEDNEDAFWDDVAAHVEAGANVVVIHNSVGLAQSTFLDLKSRLSASIPPEHVGLLHSRFPHNERATNEAHWTKLLGKEDAHRPRGSLLVATQIVEQSVDIDADLLITDLAPTELILQRIGRLHRHTRPRPEGFETPICHILHPDTDWQASAKKVKAALYPHHLIYPPISLWSAVDTLGPRKKIQLPTDIRQLLESAADKQPAKTDSAALQTFAEENERKRESMQGSARLRDVFNAEAIEDTEGAETRYGIQPTALLVLLPAAPIEQGHRIQWTLPDDSQLSVGISEFSFPLAKALQQHATRIPAYLVQNTLQESPDWLKQHLDSGVLAVRACDDSQLELWPQVSEKYTLSYRSDLGITHQKNEELSSYDDEPADFWY